MFKAKYLSVLAVFVLAINPVLTVSAAPATQGVVGFSVKAVIPDNQIDTKNTYFDLKMKPGQSENLTVMVYNNSEEELQARVSVKTASTSNSGLIDYTTDKTPDETLKIPLSTIATVEQETITIPARSSKEAIVKVKMPQDSYDGVILGGIVITEIKNNAPQGSSQGLNLENEYSYVIGVKLSETNVTVSPDLELKSIEPTLLNYRTAVVAHIQNTQAAIVKEMSVTGIVYKEGESTAFRESKKDVVDMAPNSTYAFPIDWKGERIQPGKYRLHLTAIIGEKKWEWDEEFTIASDKADTVNKESLYLAEGQPVWVFVLIGLGVLIVILLIALLLRRRKERE